MGRAYFRYTKPAEIFLRATQRAGYATDMTLVRSGNSLVHGWKVTWSKL